MSLITAGQDAYLFLSQMNLVRWHFSRCSARVTDCKVVKPIYCFRADELFHVSGIPMKLNNKHYTMISFNIQKPDIAIAAALQEKIDDLTSKRITGMLEEIALQIGLISKHYPELRIQSM